jgi:hypothetical protein
LEQHEHSRIVGTNPSRDFTINADYSAFVRFVTCCIINASLNFTSYCIGEVAIQMIDRRSPNGAFGVYAIIFSDMCRQLLTGVLPNSVSSVDHDHMTT